MKSNRAAARKREKEQRNFGEEGEAVRRMPCLVDGRGSPCKYQTTMDDGELVHRSNRAHIGRARGMGGSGGDRFRLGPLCIVHDQEAGEANTSERAAFEFRYMIDLQVEADRIALEHEPPLGIRGLAKRWHGWREAPLGRKPEPSRQDNQAFAGWVARWVARDRDDAEKSGNIWHKGLAAAVLLRELEINEEDEPGWTAPGMKLIRMAERAGERC